MILKNDVLQNFPYLEDDFDSLTDYQLFCKIVGGVKQFIKDGIITINDAIDKINIKVSKQEGTITFIITDARGEVTKTVIPIPSKLSEFENDTGFITKEVDDLTNYTLSSDLSTVATTGDYDDLLDKPTIPDVSNFITKEVDDLTNYTLTSNLSTVATTGDYDDLLDKPTIPDVSNFITKDVNDLTNYTLTSNLSTVATTGDYDDLLDKPTIPDFIIETYTTTGVVMVTGNDYNGNIDITVPSGYEVISITPLDINFADANFVQFNYASVAAKIYYTIHCGYNNGSNVTCSFKVVYKK